MLPGVIRGASSRFVGWFNAEAEWRGALSGPGEGSVGDF